MFPISLLLMFRFLGVGTGRKYILILIFIQWFTSSKTMLPPPPPPLPPQTYDLTNALV